MRRPIGSGPFLTPISSVQYEEDKRLFRSREPLEICSSLAMLSSLQLCSFCSIGRKKIRIPIPGFMLYITSVYETCLLNLSLTYPYNSMTSFQNPFKYTLQAKQETGGLLRTPSHGSRKGTYVCRTCQYLLNNFLTATLHMDGTRTLICFSCDEYPCTTSL
jgi:hypothetical protein